MDNWEKYQAMSPDKLMNEMERINKMMFKINPDHPMYSQLEVLRNSAESAYRDKIAIAQLEAHKGELNQALEIGNIESSVNSIDYNKEILDVLVTSYTRNLRNKK